MRLVVIVVVLVVGQGVGGFLGVHDDTDDQSFWRSGKNDSGSGEIFSPPGKQYRVEIPHGVVTVPPRKDSSIPSETDLSLELPGKINAGGLIKTGTLSGPAAHGTVDEFGDEATHAYASQYEGNPDAWGAGAAVERTTTTVGGRHAVEISARFSPTGEPTPSNFFRIYLVDPPSGAPILITCDWNTRRTEDIRHACDALVTSFTVTKDPP